MISLIDSSTISYDPVIPAMNSIHDDAVCVQSNTYVTDVRNVISQTIFSDGTIITLPYNHVSEYIKENITTGVMYKQFISAHIGLLCSALSVQNSVLRCPVCNAPLVDVSAYDATNTFLKEQYCVNLACNSFSCENVKCRMDNVGIPSTHVDLPPDIITSVHKFIPTNTHYDIISHLKLNCKPSQFAEFFLVPPSMNFFLSEIDTLFTNGQQLRDEAMSFTNAYKYTDMFILEGIMALKTSLGVNSNWIHI